MARASNMIIEEGHGIEELEASFRELICDFTKQGLCIAALQLCEEDQRSNVGAQIEQVSRCELARHHRVARARFLRCIEQLAKLAHAQPMNLIRRGAGRFRRFAFEGRKGNSFNSGCSRRFHHEGGIATSPCDEKKGFGCRQRVLFT
jgi:hypothetical protein